MEDIKININIIMGDPPRRSRDGIINRGNRWQRVKIIDPIWFACGFTTSRYTDDPSTLTGIAW
jgi:hypothetical protein